MLMDLAKRTAAHLPHGWQQALKRKHFRKAIRRGTFRTDEPEWERCAQWLSPGDWAVDVGANIGHYTKRFSDLVGATGRVIAFEPVPATFELLAANAAQFRHANVTLLNLAASEDTRVFGISVPSFETGLRNYYGAALTHDGTGIQVMACPIDGLGLQGRVRVLKVDAEGHDAVVLRGARRLIADHRPVVVIESAAEGVHEMMRSLGYEHESIPGSPNTIFHHPRK